MRRTALVVLASVCLTGTASAQPSTPATLRLSVDDAVKMALDENVDLKADRLDPQISDMAVAAAAGAFKPTVSSSVNSNNQLLPPSSFLIPTNLRSNVVTTNAGLSQRLPWFGTSYGVSWSTTHTDSNSILNSYNPLLQSGLSLNVSQPLLRDLKIDSSRQQVIVGQINRDIADTRLRESLVHTTADVKRAYWNLVSAHATVDARKSALELAQELVRVNKAKVDVGTAPPLDLVSALAEVASDQEQLIIAETAVKQIEDQLRVLIMDPSKRESWNTAIEAVDTPPESTPTLDVDAAITRALAERADLVRAHKDIANADASVKFSANQKLPDVHLNANYNANALGGQVILRDYSNGFPGTIVGPGPVTPFGSVLNQLFASHYPTWTVGFTVSYPVGQSTDQANHAKAQIERAQADARLKGDEGRVIQQIRNAAYQVDMNAKRIETTRAARELAEQRLDAERKRLDVGMSTSFLVIQAQRDLAQAKTNEVGAVLAYDLSLVDFDALQQAGPSGSQGSQSQQTAVPSSTGGTTTAGTSTGAASGTTVIPPTGTASSPIPGLPGSPQGQ
jgi:outer membrane protein TolC